ncbi:MAG: hypothetical protein LQ350_008456 [Teloschistes chrysophthalmus]|nr:MAG: hypothetical protein LQ350_008456 [Niorma chrysophthalma]
MVENRDRERLLARLRSGEISEAEFDEELSDLAMADLEKNLGGTSLGPYPKPSNAFVYPAGRRWTLQQVEQMRSAERKLDAFWDRVDASKMRSRTGKTLLQWLGQRVTIRDLRRTGPWQPVTPKPFVATLPPTSYEPFPQPTSTTIDRLPTQPSTKQKTRGEASSTHEPTQSASVTEIAESTLQSFYVPTNVHKTMTAFFPASVQDREGQKVIWNDFVHAMGILGFEIQKRHASE